MLEKKPRVFNIFFFIFIFCQGLVLSAWTVYAERGGDSYTGVYKVLVFLDSFLNIGQGIIVYLIFGLSSKHSLLHLKTFFKNIAEKIVIRQKSVIDEIVI